MSSSKTPDLTKSVYKQFEKERFRTQMYSAIYHLIYKMNKGPAIGYDPLLMCSVFPSKQSVLILKAHNDAIEKNLKKIKPLLRKVEDNFLKKGTRKQLDAELNDHRRFRLAVLFLNNGGTNEVFDALIKKTSTQIKQGGGGLFGGSSGSEESPVRSPERRGSRSSSRSRRSRSGSRGSRSRSGSSPNSVPRTTVVPYSSRSSRRHNSRNRGNHNDQLMRRVDALSGEGHHSSAIESRIVRGYMTTEQSTVDALANRDQQQQLAVIENELQVPLNRLFGKVVDRLRNPKSNEKDEFILEIERLVNIFFDGIRQKLQAPLNQELESMERDVKSLQPNLGEKAGLALFAAGGVIMTYANVMESLTPEDYSRKDACNPDGKTMFSKYVYDSECGGFGVNDFFKGSANKAMKIPAEFAKLALPLISCGVTIAGFQLYQATKKDIRKFDNAKKTYRSEVENIIENNITRLRNSLIEELQIMPRMFGASLAGLLASKLRTQDLNDEEKVNQVLQETIREIINFGETIVEQMTTGGLVLNDSDIAALSQSRHKIMMVVGNYGLEYKQAYSQIMAQSTSGVNAAGSLGRGFFSTVAGAASSVASVGARGAMGAATGFFGKRTKKKRRT